MKILISFILGCIQGLTEFLPVSSSGHLVLFQNLFGLREPELFFDITLHLGTLAAVVIYFYGDLKQMLKEIPGFSRALWAKKQRQKMPVAYPQAMLALWVILGSVPTGLIGFFFQEPLERLFGSIRIVAAMFFITGLLLFLTRFLPGAYNRRKQVGFWTALAVGAAQSIAMIPGISRSGATIACGLFCKMEKESAARFSFLLSIPAILGAALLKFDFQAFDRIGFVPLVIGFSVALGVGLVALKFLMLMAKRGQLYYFSPYCWLMGLLTLFTAYYL